jgi:hypothetical protein
VCKCDLLFTRFHWKDITTVVPSRDLPEKGVKGVYVIRVRQRGVPVDNIISSGCELVEATSWGLLTKKVRSRLDRLNRIRDCPIIYIGAAPTSFKTRFKDLTGRHVVMYPTWGLLWGGWKMDYGWLQDDISLGKERQLMDEYFRIHNRLPALNERY